jgi:crotonobetainyl-CoA:carnitine CoA-transferase CaiB-like acyl-CoA transferase
MTESSAQLDPDRAHGALEGVRVLELSTSMVGAVAGMLLADLGADVLHAQTVPSRVFDEPGYVCWHRNKTRTMVNPRAPEGSAELRRLERAADALIVDGTMTQLAEQNLDAAHVLERSPHVVHIWAPPYGERGRWSELDANPYFLPAVSGLADNFTATDDRPVLPVVPLLSYEQGALAATMAVAGLLRARRTGEGQAVTVSGLRAVAAMLAAIFVDVPGIVRQPKNSGAAIPHFRYYQCADGEWLYLAALAQPFFFRALEVMDLVEVMALPEIGGEWLNLQVPTLNRGVHDALERRFGERPRHEWLALLAGADVPCAPVESREQWFESDTIASNGLRARLTHSELGSVDLPGVPLSFSREPTRVHHLADGHHGKASDHCWLENHRTVATRTGRDDSIARSAAPLEGLRVLDLASFVAGSFGPSILASLGADVIKVETEGGDPYRDFAASFAAYNQGKRGLGLDVKHPEGHAVLLDLVRDADVVVDGVRPSVRSRLGIDFGTLQAANRRLVRCSVTGWGETGPLAETPAFDPLVQARSGLMSAQGGDDAPVYASMLVHDVGTGTLAALGILAALFEREGTGVGQEVTLSLASSSMLFQSGELTQFTGRSPALVGGRDWPGPHAVERLYECANGWIMVAADENQRDALLELAGVPTDVRIGSDESELVGAMAAAFHRVNAEDAVERLRGVGVPAVTVLGRGAVYTDSWFADNRFFRSFEQPGLGRCLAVSGYASWRGQSVEYDRPAPRNGEHTREILEAGGFEPARLEELVACGAVHVFDGS